MPIPDFQSIMRPLLEFLSDGSEKDRAETIDHLATHFHLTEPELAQLLPSGKQAVFANRVAWAKSHLKGAGLLESPKRGTHRLTKQGLEFLGKHSGPVNMAVLNQFPAYVTFRTPKSSPNGPTPPPPPGGSDSLTPEEHIEYGYVQHLNKLSSELLDKVMAAPPAFFEQLVVELLLAMGYGGSRSDAGRAVGKSGDGGIDGIIKEDRLGLDTIYIQAKRWEGTVSRPEIQKFAGALQGVRARKGIFITTSSFSNEATNYAANIDNKIVLIDGESLADLMIEHNIGVARVQSYELKRLDTDYFSVDD